MSNRNRPYYQKLYADIIRDKYPEKADLYASLLSKKNWIAFDVLRANNILFGESRDGSSINKQRKHFAYDEKTILKILKHMSDYGLNNSETAREFGMSRNTISKWKEIFKEEIETWST